MSTPNEIGLRIETLTAGAITAGLLILIAVVLGPVLALLGFFMVALILSILVALVPKSRPQIADRGTDAQAGSQFEYR